jgi:small subunit ribosomal protein S9
MENFQFLATTVGRRKIAVANLELHSGMGKMTINGYRVEDFFSGHPRRLWSAQIPFCILDMINFDANVNVKGGGQKRQSLAIQLALVRALVIIQPETRILFRKYQLLTRDSRTKERRKYGFKKARKAPQFSKRS